MDPRLLVLLFKVNSWLKMFIKLVKIDLTQILQVMKFEMQLHKIRFIIITIISIFLMIFIGVLPTILLPFGFIPSSPYGFFTNSLNFFSFLAPLFSCFLFSGVICTEYKRNVGFLRLPILKKHQILIGKFLGNYILTLIVVAILYVMMTVFAFLYYGPPIVLTPIISYMFLSLFLLAYCSVVTLLSSFMPSALSVIITALALFLFGFTILQSIGQAIFPELEPLYSLMYVFNIVTVSVLPDFMDQERVFVDPESNYHYWSFPTVEGALLMLTIYFFVSFTLAYIIFRRRRG
jgi:ABC-type transport system involved in multi-copper enzyme maturation permease subunit